MKHYLFVIDGSTNLATGRNPASALAELSAQLDDDSLSPPTEIIEVPESHLEIVYANTSFYYSCLVEYGLIH